MKHGRILKKMAYAFCCGRKRIYLTKLIHLMKNETEYLKVYYNDCSVFFMLNSLIGLIIGSALPINCVLFRNEGQLLRKKMFSFLQVLV